MTVPACFFYCPIFSLHLGMALRYIDITRFIEDTAQDFREEIRKSGNYAWRLAKTQIEKMDTNFPTQSDAPHVMQSDKNRAIISSVGVNLASTFLTDSFNERVLSIGIALEQINEALIEYYENNFGDLSSEAIRQGDAVMQAGGDSLFQAVSQQNLYDNIFSPAVDSMFSNMYEGVTLNQFIQNAEAKVNRRFETYFGPLVASLMQTAFSNVNDIFGNSFKLVWVSYKRRSSSPPERRDFCDHHESGKSGNAFYYHIDEVRIEWPQYEGGNWQGAFPGTNGSNILSNRGGYNCLHSFDFHRASEVSDKDKARAKRKGYI